MFRQPLYDKIRLMKIPGEKIAIQMRIQLKKERKKLIKKPRLVTFLIGTAADQLSFVKIKKKMADRIGVDFEFVNLKKTPAFETFMMKIKEKSQDAKVTGIIIQQPLPAQLSTDSIYNYIPLEKEIEGHRRKSCYYPPIGMAVLTILKYIYLKSKSIPDIFIDIQKDRSLFKRAFHNKKVVLIGRGITGGGPIGKTLTNFKINYINTNSNTPNPETYFKEADIIISSVGKKVIDPSTIKPGVVLINVGLRHEGNKLRGDYDEKEIKKIASFYTPTPGGIGPIDIVYLYKNLIDATKLQQ